MAQLLQRVQLDRTPTTEHPGSLDYIDEKLGSHSDHNMVFQMPED